ncbi:MAG: shikimate kinase [Spirochaetia bacterium]|jgi:shikimate kinase
MKELPPRIALIGFMGAGKTTVGKILARELGYDFVDTDDAIVRRAGAPIARIFQTQGEAAFRRLEAEALESLAGRLRTVIAAGGGAPAQESNRQFFRTRAATFHLRVSMENVRGRTRTPDGSVRPLLSQGDREVQALYDARLSIYEELGRSVETDGRTPLEVARQIILQLEGPTESRGSGETP